MSSGHLALILHAHLPFVRHPEHEHFLEEDWLFEAITETYIPLLQMMQRLVGDNVPFKLTISLTPTLCAMLRDELLRERYVRHLDLLIDLAARERRRNQNEPELAELSRFYIELFTASRHFFVDHWNGDLLAAFRQMRDAGALEIIGCAATHGLLPLIQKQSNEAARAQVLIGRDAYASCFGAEPAGFWLPECGYGTGVDSILQEANVRWFVLDAHGLLFGNPQPQRAIYAPCYTPDGPAAFARDRDSSRQVWSAEEGYPGDPAYREFYRDIGFDLPLEHLGPVARGVRKFSGVKYHRITGGKKQKELYDRAAAEKAAEAHAAHFVEQRRAQFRQLANLDFDPMVVVPFDAELFGHWWFEGPRFLETFIRKTAFDQRDFQLTTPTNYLAGNPTQQTIEPAESSWGENGYLEVWTDKNNSWIYPHLHSCAQRMTGLAREYANKPLNSGSQNLTGLTSQLSGEPAVSELNDRVLKQLARELLLAQSSDWAFLMRTGTAREYATKRTLDHLGRFTRLHDQFTGGAVDEKFLADCERRDNLFPEVNWRYYA
jgi:1,4-alpha-glucan branching enzyme